MTDRPLGPAPSTAPLDLDRLVDIAVGVFLRRGYEGTSMHQIAQVAGVRKPSLYHHVSGKEELLERGVGRALGAFESMLAEPEAGPDREPTARLRHVLRRTCELVAANVPEVALLMRARGNTPTERRALRERRRLNELLTDMIARAVGPPGRPPTVEPELAARLVFGMITSTVDWWRPRGGTLTATDLAAAVDALVFGQLLPAGDDRDEARQADPVTPRGSARRAASRRPAASAGSA